jgi:lipopolysaccharide export system permease protein
MSTCEMLAVIQEARTDRRGALHDREELLLNDLRGLLALRPVGPPPPDGTEDRLPAYCRWIDWVQGIISLRTAEAQTPAQRPPEPQNEEPTAPPARLQLSNWAQVATATDRIQDADRRADRFLVEVHKKWAISFACVSFVIIGIVMALRFPRGGIGLVIGGGLLVFAVHYVGLTAGESLADRGFVSPWASMWTPNIVLTLIGLIGLVRVSRESGSTRGGDFQEVVDGVRHLVRRLGGRAPRTSAGEAP